MSDFIVKDGVYYPRKGLLFHHPKTYMQCLSNARKLSYTKTRIKELAEERTQRQKDLKIQTKINDDFEAAERMNSFFLLGGPDLEKEAS